MKLVTIYKSVTAFAKHGKSHAVDDRGEPLCGTKYSMPFTKHHSEGMPSCRLCQQKAATFSEATKCDS